LAEVVLTKGLSSATTAGITGRHTDVSKAITQLTAKGYSQINPADQATGTLRVGIAISLAL
jgi:hypothetical protein